MRRPRSPRGARLVPELQLTEQELHAFLGFLADAARRGELMLLSDVTHTSILVDAGSRIGLAGAIVDVWQINQRGLYDDQDDRKPEGTLRARVRCDASGTYEITTVLPGPYHIPSMAGPVFRLLNTLGRDDEVRPTSISG